MLPKKVKIGPHTFKVTSAVKSWKKLEEDTDGVYSREDHYGLTDMDSLTVYIHPDMPKSIERNTVIHELIHAINFVSAFTHNDSSVKVKNLDEAIARMTSPLWLGMLRDNPKLVSYLTAK